MCDYYKSVPGYFSMVANVSLVMGIVLLFFNWHISIFLLTLTIILWFLSRYLHKRALEMSSLFENKLKESLAEVAKKYKSSEGIERLKREGFSDEQIKVMREEAEKMAGKGIFRD